MMGFPFPDFGVRLIVLRSNTGSELSASALRIHLRVPGSFGLSTGSNQMRPMKGEAWQTGISAQITPSP
jgi:hypothetical protein